MHVSRPCLLHVLYIVNDLIALNVNTATQVMTLHRIRLHTSHCNVHSTAQHSVAFTFSSLPNGHDIYWLHITSNVTVTHNHCGWQAVCERDRRNDKMEKRGKNMYQNKQIFLTHSQHTPDTIAHVWLRHR